MSGSFIIDDLGAFYNEDEFADSATYATVGGVASGSFPVIFDEGYIDIDPETGDDVSVNPSLRCKESDVSNLTHKGVFTIDSVDYTVHRFNTIKGEHIVELHK